MAKQSEFSCRVKRGNVMKKRFIYLIINIIFLSSFSTGSASDSAVKKVLVLHSYHQGYEWGDSINKGIIDIFKTEENVDVHIANMDLLRNNSDEYLKSLEEFYRLRFDLKNQSFDVLIVSDDPAFNFVLSRRDKLFKDIPIVFCGVNNFTPDRIKGHRKITGVNESISIKETVDIAIKLREKARKIAVISGSGETYRQNLELFKKSSHFFKEIAEIVYLSELEPDDLIRKLRDIGHDDIVIYLGYLQTPAGVKLSVKESIELIKGSTDAAIFGCWDFLIPHGVTGGKVVHGYSQGEMAAELALRIIKGEKPDRIPVMMKSPNRYCFDDVLIHKYGMSDKLIPVDSIIVNQAPESIMRHFEKINKSGLFSYNFFDNHGSIMLLIDASSGTIVDANRSAFNFYGYSNLVGKKISEISTLPPDEINAVFNKIKSLKQNRFTIEHQLASGERRIMDIYSYPVEIDGMKFLFAINYDITDRINAERGVTARNMLIIGISLTAVAVLIVIAVMLLKNIYRRKESEALLKKSERKLDTMLQTMVDGMVTVDVDGRINYSNPAANEILGTGSETLGKLYHSRDLRNIDEHGEPYPADQLPLAIAMREKRAVKNIEHGIKASNGEIKWLSLNSAPLFDDAGGFTGGIASFRDITLHKKDAERINNLLKEKELLLSEVHHRIKNNMNTIKGLLTLQLSAEENLEAAESIRDAESRVQSMIMLYDRLYSTENFRELSVKDYLEPLTEEIIGSFPNSGKVKVETDIENFILNVKELSPLGIILNELLTNVMKYAFTGRDNGVIKVSATVTDNHVTMSVQDDGVGVPEQINFENSTGFGLELVKMLVSQIGGRVRVERGGGTKFVLEFDM